MKNFLKSSKTLLILLSVFFIIVPFFWLKPGEMDLGGDSTRLYFYDPLAYMHNIALSLVFPDGMGGVDPEYYFLPYLLLLAGLKSLLGSSTMLISLFNVFKLFGGFIAIYLIVLEILALVYKEKNNEQKNINSFSAILAGLFYIISPITNGNWDKALTSHNQIFLNPLMFLLLLRFCTRNNNRYIWLVLFISVLFAPNFEFTSAPAIFSFYPLSILFLILFLFITKTNKLSWKKIFLLPFLFFGLHAFHLIPQAINLFVPGSFANTKVFDQVSAANESIRYFIAILPLAKVSWSILLPTINQMFQFGFVVVPLTILIAYMLVKKQRKIFHLTGIFFLLTLYLFSANITNLGNDIYKHLYYIPGFSMFRNFIGQWNMVYAFFYALLFGQAIKILFSDINKSIYTIFSFVTIILFFLSSSQFILNPLNKVYAQSRVHTVFEMDPQYLEALQYIKNLPDDSKILIFPFTDSFYQVVAGKNGGAYMGSSSISYLTGKKSFSGYQIMTPAFSEKLFALARKKDYEGIRRLMTYLNIHYVFYNSDKKIYDSTFPASPYTYARESLPKTQNDYKTFISQIADKKIFEKGPYQLFTTRENEYLPLFYVAKQLKSYEPIAKDLTSDPSAFIDDNNEEVRTVYIDVHDCMTLVQVNECQNFKQTEQIPQISFNRINPTKYVVHVNHARESYSLVFLTMYHPQWKIFLSPKEDINLSSSETKQYDEFFNKPFETLGLKQIAGKTHVIANGYANVWEITPQDVGRKETYSFIVEMTGQTVFYEYLIVSSVVFVLFIGWGIMLFLPKQVTVIIKQIYASTKQKKQ